MMHFFRIKSETESRLCLAKKILTCGFLIFRLVLLFIITDAKMQGVDKKTETGINFLGS